ncbi:MAG: hypothetical protein KGL99_03145 [Burkholderiales bacterium]|nr:hypothetical protein [Burkholderiales bacterium]
MSVFPTSRFRALIIVVLCGVLALASGCSALRLGYGTAPEITYWWLDGYVDFDHAQSVKVRDALARWFAWHRRTQLPDYAALLERARTEVLADTTAARVCQWQADIVARARTALDQAVPDAADLVLTVTPQQIRHIERHYAKKNDEFRDDYVQPDLRKRADKALERTIDRAEMLYGHLDDAQRARIAQALTRSPFDPELWLAERQQRQQEALQMLRRLSAEGAGPDQAQAALRVYVEHLLRSPREAYRRYAARLDEFNCAFAAELHNSTSAAQRRTAARKLAGWEGDLRALAPPVASAAPAS